MLATLYIGLSLAFMSLLFIREYTNIIVKPIIVSALLWLSVLSIIGGAIHGIATTCGV